VRGCLAAVGAWSARAAHLPQLSPTRGRGARPVAAANGAAAAIEYGDSYPVTVNDARGAQLALDVLQELYGRDNARLLSAPLMATEEFSYVLEEVPGALIVLGARPARAPAAGARGMHSAAAIFDDGVLAAQAEALAEIAWRRLHAG